MSKFELSVLHCNWLNQHDSWQNETIINAALIMLIVPHVKSESEKVRRDERTLKVTFIGQDCARLKVRLKQILTLHVINVDNSLQP